MNCGQHHGRGGQRRHRHHGVSDCCCCSPGHGQHGFQRRFSTRDEMKEHLECYLSCLKKEVQAVEERLAQLEG